MKPFLTPRTALLFAVLSALASLTTASAENPHTPAFQGRQPDLVTGTSEVLCTDLPLVRHVYLAAPNVLAITVDSQQLLEQPLQKYVKQPGDQIKFARPQTYGPDKKQFFWGRTLIRDGKTLGELVGPDLSHYIPNHQLVGQPLDLSRAHAPASYALSSDNDPNYVSPTTPSAVSRKTKPNALEWTTGIQQASHRHEIYLKLPRPLTTGRTYRLSFPNNPQFPSPLTFTFDDARLRTEALQVNQVGYHPRQTQRLARLSMWLGAGSDGSGGGAFGGGVDFSSLKTFNVVDDKTSAVVFTGPITLRKAGNLAKEMAPERTDDPSDELPYSVYHLDFSNFSTPGVYRIAVPGLGSSFPFRIDNDVWLTSTQVSATGFLNQRSGIALGPPHTPYVRPRNFHPDDGVKIHRTDPAIFYDAARFPGPFKLFERIQASILPDTNIPEAWGGWHDAADYDRSILPQDHMRAVHAMLVLYESNPAYFAKLNLNLPESGDKTPDVLDEALWCLDLFRRIQQPDGGIPSAVESIEHPSEPSFLLAQPTAATPPTPQTCHLYAAAAARMAVALAPYDAARSAAFRDSALRAVAWADANPQVPDVYRPNPRTHALRIAHSALWLYRATGDARWHDKFKSLITSPPPPPIPSTNPAAAPPPPPAPMLTAADGPSPVNDYAFFPDTLADPALRDRCRAAVISAADAKAERIAGYTLFIRNERYNWDERIGSHWTLAAAHLLTNDPKYLLAIERQADLGLGSNPSNTSYTTGLGARQVVPYFIDARYLGVPYPPGISTLGPAPRNAWMGEAIERKLTRNGLHPTWKSWPWAESNFNYKEPMINEYTVGGNMANLLHTRAYLAQHYAGAK